MAAQFPVIDIPSSVAALPTAAVEYLVDWLVRQHRVEAAHATAVKQRVMDREALGSTAVGQGIAIPHVVATVQEIAGAIGRSSHGIPWPGGPDETPVRLVCLVITPRSQIASWPETLEKIAIQIRELH